MTIRSFFLIAIIGLWQSLTVQAQTLAPPAAEPASTVRAKEEDQPERLQQMQEDLTVFRVLFNRSTARYYNFPGGLSDKVHSPPLAEGVYLKGQGVIYTCGLPQPATHPVKKAAAVKVENSPWQRTLLEVRGEKPEPPAKQGETKQSLSEIVLTLLAENGHHFSKLAEQERITIAITLRPAHACTRCHDVLMERRAGVGMAPMGLSMPRYDLKTVTPPPAAGTGLYGTGTPAPVPSAPSPRDDEQIDIQIGDLAMKQGRYKEAEEAYTRIIQRLTAKKDVDQDVRRLSLLAEVSSKLAQTMLVTGQADKAKAALEMAQKFSQAAVKLTQKSGKEKPETLPPQLILSATKSQLDQVAAHKISFEEFSKAVTVEYRTFEAPEAKKEAK
jgi:hypothetical protein